MRKNRGGKNKNKKEGNLDLQNLERLQQIFDSVSTKNVRISTSDIVNFYDNIQCVDAVAALISFYNDEMPQNRAAYVNLAHEVSQRFQNYLWASLLMISSGQLLYSLYLKGSITLQQARKRCSIEKRIYYFFAKELGIPHYYPEYQYIFSFTPVTNNETRDDTEDNAASLVRADLLDQYWLTYDNLRNTGYLNDSIQGYIISNDVDHVIDLANDAKFDPTERFESSPFSNTKRTFNYLEFSAFYGSFDSFNYFIGRGLKVTKQVVYDAVFGENKDIVEYCSKNGGDFEGIISFAISHHKNTILTWLMTNYNQEYTPLDCIKGQNLQFLKKSNMIFSPECLYYAARSGYVPLAKYVMENIQDYEYKDENGDTSLIIATRFGFYEMCHFLVKNGCNVNAKGKNGETPLYIAGILGINELVVFYLSEGADFREITDKNETVLNALAFSGNKDSVLALMSYGMDLNTNPISPLYTSVVDGNLLMMDFFLNKGANPNKKHPFTGETPLHKALLKFDFRYTTTLLERGADIFIEDNKGIPPIAVAYIRGDPRITAVLTKKNRPNLRQSFKDGKTFLHYAAMANNTTGLDYLLNKIHLNPNQVDKEMNSPLFYALEKRNLENAEFLLNHGADINVRDAQGQTLLHYFVRSNDKEIVTFLIDHKILMDELDMNHMTCFELAAELDRKEIINILIDKGALFMTHLSFTTPAHIATKTDNLELVKKFVDLGFEIDFADENNQTMLHVAAIYSAMNVMIYLLNKMADVTLKDDNGDTPLSLAVKNNHYDAAKLLLNEKSDPNTRDKDEFPLAAWCVKCDRKDLFKLLSNYGLDTNLRVDLTKGDNLLIYAVSIKRSDWISMLINSGIDKNGKNNKGQTALILAAEMKNEASIRELVNGGCDVNIQNSKGITAVSIVIEKDLYRILPMMISAGADLTIPDEEGTTPIELVSSDKTVEVLTNALSTGYDINRKVDGENTHLLLATFEQRSGLLSFLLKNKADTQRSDIHRRTALYHAVIMNEYEIAYILMKNGADPNYPCDDGRTPLNMATEMDNLAMQIILGFQPKQIPEEKKEEIQEILDFCDEKYKKYQNYFNDFSDDDDSKKSMNDNSDEDDENKEEEEAVDEEGKKYVLKRGGRRGTTKEQILKKKAEKERKELKKRIRKQIRKYEREEQKKAKKREKLRLELENRIAKRKRKYENNEEESDDESHEEEDIIEIVTKKAPPKPKRKLNLQNYNDNKHYKNYENKFSDLEYILELILALVIIILIARYIKKLGY
ncbi:hypothetical protein TVAG_196650 [Trichomonas vaginalis G3]|uniref:DUF3447 domain-containing protein n=1 Tax=Trichomonas vaginalis (strain ATCC PRA-98 / G3) TaxID=412133 RepID=A2FCY5_TRIV3|nr:spectrin binding [Trichomonas vaginalis G3]EAX97223.1 hypothetical protein TVAG_196650 [Trichomonas vaginalis G3]KAI5509530.1 spectrin binding [Trichomonas vaginalis G3]|eukprot:XP_001310153.1 hypothetical protein [Trichomonas vaginalis G3]